MCATTSSTTRSSPMNRRPTSSSASRSLRATACWASTSRETSSATSKATLSPTPCRHALFQAPPPMGPGPSQPGQGFSRVGEAVRQDPRGAPHGPETRKSQPRALPRAPASQPMMAPGPRRPRTGPTVVPTFMPSSRCSRPWRTPGIAVNLDAYSDQPLNRGWMNVFRRWISSGIFHAHWPAVRGEFSEGFVRFCENELNLTVQEPKIAWLDAGAPTRPGPKNDAALDVSRSLPAARRRVLARVASHRRARDSQRPFGSGRNVRTRS